MKSAVNLRLMYLNRLKRQKQKENLEIGKIKFEIQPIYLTSNQMITTTRLNYGNEEYKLQDKTRKPKTTLY